MRYSQQPWIYHQHRLFVDNPGMHGGQCGCSFLTSEFWLSIVNAWLLIANHMAYLIMCGKSFLVVYNNIYICFLYVCIIGWFSNKTYHVSCHCEDPIQIPSWGVGRRTWLRSSLKKSPIFWPCLATQKYPIESTWKTEKQLASRSEHGECVSQATLRFGKSGRSQVSNTGAARVECFSPRAEGGKHPPTCLLPVNMDGNGNDFWIYFPYTI